MNCDCIKQFETKLKEQFEDPEAHLLVGFVFKDDGGTLTVPTIEALVRKKKRDGSFKKPESISVIPSFCPFCGEKLDKTGLNKEEVTTDEKETSTEESRERHERDIG